MTYSFQLIHGTLAPPLLANCGIASTQDDLGRLSHSEKEIPLESLEKLRETLESRKEGMWLEKNMVLLSAASCPYIKAICFVPATPGISQLIYAKRDDGKAEKRGFVVPNDQFPHERATRVSCLKNESAIEETTMGLDALLIKVVRTILGHFLEDAQTRGLALTYPDGTGNLEIHLWLKA
jgi:hypothetical protein